LQLIMEHHKLYYSLFVLLHYVTAFYCFCNKFSSSTFFNVKFLALYRQYCRCDNEWKKINSMNCDMESWWHYL